MMSDKAQTQAIRTACKVVLLKLLLLMALPAVVKAQDFIYTTNNDTLTITGYTGPGGTVDIPSTIDGLPVTSIGNNAFQSQGSLTSVVIPNSVTDIGISAFRYCTSLSSVTIGTGITNIGGGAFYQCINLSSITIPNGVTSIGGGAFYQCISLGSITIPNGVTSILDSTFNQCLSLTDVTIPNSVTNIGNYAFQYSTSLSSVTIGSSVAGIGSRAFLGCQNLSAIRVDALNAVFSSEAGVLFNKSQTALIQCPARKGGSYAIPNGVTSIGEYAFAYCIGLSNITIPNSVTSMGSYAFSDCRGLTEVTIPSSVTSLGSRTFQYCSGLTRATFGDGIPSIGYYVFANCTSLAIVIIPGSVSNIPEVSFQGCNSLVSIYFKGNAILYGNTDDPTFGVPFSPAIGAVVYYLPGTIGWGPTFRHLPTMLWNPQPQNTSASFGVRSNRFGFNITGTANIPLVVEAATNPASQAWVPVQSCTLTNGSIYFCDPDCTNYPARFYRIRSP